MSNSNALSARDRIKSLVDENSFVEIGALVTKRNTDFNMDSVSAPDDGVVTGYALIKNKPVYIYSQDADVLGGSVGEMHARQIVNIYNLAIKTGTPVVGILDSSGIRVQESVDALDAFGQIYSAMVRANGLIPQITAVLGNCGGGMAVLAALSDFTFMEKTSGSLFVNSPDAVENNYKEKLDTSAATFKGEAGAVEFVYDDAEQMFEGMRDLITILPLNAADNAECDEVMDDLNREVPDFASVVGDPVRALEEISDNNFFLEVCKDASKEMVTGFILLDGMTIGAVANRSFLLDDAGQKVEEFETRLTTVGCYKAASFVKLCDRFNIPVLSFTNVNGFAGSLREEASIGNAVATLTKAFSGADVAKVNLITGEAYGSAYVAMNSKHIGADMVFALPTAKVGVMDANVAAKIMFPGAEASVISEKADAYAKATDVKAAAARGFVDSIIEPASVRKQLLFAFEMLYTKSI